MWTYAESKQRKKTVILLCLKDLTVPCPSCTYNAAAVPGSLQFWLPCLLFPSSWCHISQMFSYCATSALPPLRGKKYAVASAPFLISQKGNTRSFHEISHCSSSCSCIPSYTNGQFYCLSTFPMPIIYWFAKWNNIKTQYFNSSVLIQVKCYTRMHK